MNKYTTDLPQKQSLKCKWCKQFSGSFDACSECRTLFQEAETLNIVSKVTGAILTARFNGWSGSGVRAVAWDVVAKHRGLRDE